MIDDANTLREHAGTAALTGAAILADPQLRLLLLAIAWQGASLLISWMRLQAQRLDQRRQSEAQSRRDAAPAAPSSPEP